ncbi:MAG TPA: FCD domain-containing protein [Acetobacteraceae bacterium]|nr:FCD domain-containing protein [Acetobacteraceae bacterium]
MEPPLSELSLLRSRTLAEAVQEEVLRLIREGALRTGEKLGEVEFAARLGVSRATIREAFRALGESGLLTLEKNRGAVVRVISPAEADELYEVRAGLDAVVGARLAPQITAEQLETLEALLARLAECASSCDVAAYYPLNVAFHDSIVAMAGNATLLRLYRRVINLMHLLRRTSFAGAESFSASTAEHRAIVDALATRDAEAAAEAMRRHVRAGHARMQNGRATAAGAGDAEAGALVIDVGV